MNKYHDMNSIIPRIEAKKRHIVNAYIDYQASINNTIDTGSASPKQDRK
jgi:hypothetical protein